jgi:CRISPR/Cas system CSM-associated protein Csm3 (group 7 of RAMP superfamily)
MTESGLQSIEITLRILPQSALHIGTGLGLAQILDDRIVRGPHPLVSGASVPYIPGSSLKGRLRYHARRLAAWLSEDTKVEQRLFGTVADPGALIFADAHIADLRLARTLANEALQPLLARSERSFVGLSRGRRVTLEQRLFRLELADGEIEFESRIQGYLPSATAAGDLALLLAAAADLTHLGGHKARGLGACRCRVVRVLRNNAEEDPHTLMEVLR